MVQTIKTLQVGFDDVQEVMDSDNSITLNQLDTEHKAVVTELTNEHGDIDGTILYVPGRTYLELLNA